MAAATDKDYSTLQDIREEAGLQHKLRYEELTGTANGSNKDFYTQNTYVVDRNYDDTLDTTDVVLYVNGAAVAVDSVNATSGKIVANAAPASNAEVTADYDKSDINDTKVTERRDEAISYVQTKLAGIVDYEAWTDATIPARIKSIVRMYASGLLLIRDYGSGADIDEASKDGYKRLKWAKDEIADYLKDVANNSDSTSEVGFSTKSDGNIFQRETDLTNNSYPEGSVDSQEAFMRKDT